MSKLSPKAIEVLESCLSAESPEVRAKVYKIIELSGLEPSDPMFLVLALTGQMRVLLEEAPSELMSLLKGWKEQASLSLEQIKEGERIISVKQKQQEEMIRNTLEKVTIGYIEEIKRVGMATISAISEANNETLTEAKLVAASTTQLSKKIVELYEEVELGRQKSENLLKELSGRVEKSAKNLSTTAKMVKQVNTDIEKLLLQTVWVKITEWISPLSVLAIVLGAGFLVGVSVVWIKYNDTENKFARNLLDWNIKRIGKCQADKNQKCTIWIERPPEEKQ